MAVSANRLELLQIADAVAREKAIDRGIVIAAMEDAIAKAARSRYGAETDVHAEIEPKTGDLRLTRHMLVVENVENPSNQITLEEARKRHPAAQVGDTIADPLPPLEYGRIAAQSAKQVIVQKVLDEERERIEVVVPDQQLSLAIGRRGQNVRLASQLTGWDIDILTEQEESERR